MENYTCGVIQVAKLPFRGGEMLELDFPSSFTTSPVTEILYNQWMVGKTPPKKIESGEYTYFITLTCTSDFLALYIRLKRILKSKQFAIGYAVGSLEVTKKGQPHVHMWVRSTCKYLDKSKLTRSNKDMVDLQRPKSDENVMKYVLKSDTKPTAEYLNKYSLSFPTFIYTNSLGIVWQDVIEGVQGTEGIQVPVLATQEATKTCPKEAGGTDCRSSNHEKK